MSYYYYYDPQVDQYIIKKVNNIEVVNKKYYKINNYIIILKDQVKNNIKEVLKSIKTSKKINIL